MCRATPVTDPLTVIVPQYYFGAVPGPLDRLASDLYGMAVDEGPARLPYFSSLGPLDGSGGQRYPHVTTAVRRSRSQSQR